MPNTTFSSFQKVKTGLSKWQRTESNYYQEDRLSCDQGLLFIHFKNSVVLDFLPVHAAPCFMMGFVAAGSLIELSQEVSHQTEIKQRHPRHLCTRLHSTRGSGILPQHPRFMPTSSSDTQPALPAWILAVLVPGKNPVVSRPKL